MLEVHDLHMRFGPVTALAGVSFAAPDGQITGLLGENGAGKTTTLNILTGSARSFIRRGTCCSTSPPTASTSRPRAASRPPCWK
jgi:ABC-type multidrug transport system ATPase subunit